jgi:quercetin dioxygenase-like cupin family protein
MNNRFAASCAILALVSATVALGASAQSYPPLTRQPVLGQSLPAGSPVPRLVKGARVVFAPGQPTGAHLHPVSVVGVVT